MAVTRRQADSTRQAIQATLLVKRLQDEAMGELELTKGQRESAMFLIGMAMPKPTTSIEANITGEVLWPLPKTALDK